MTDKELLDFCKQYNVELGISYDSNRDSYHLRMRRGWVQINYIFSSVCVDTAKAWNAVMKSKLEELERNLTRMERVGKEEETQ